VVYALSAGAHQKKTTTPVDASDRKFYIQASEKSGDKKIIKDFDAALTAQRPKTPATSTSSTTPPAGTTSASLNPSSGTPPPPRVTPERAQDPSDQKFYNMAADRLNRANDLDVKAGQLHRDSDVLATASPYAAQAMRQEARELEREANGLRRTHVDGKGDLGGTGTSEIRKPFEVSGANQADIGRAVNERALQDTADDGQIQRDEFEVVELENGKYIVVLPGVIDLSDKVQFKGTPPFVEKPHFGWDPDSRSVRDTEMAAARSSTSTGIDDNLYAEMVRDYMNENVPKGADIMIVGHSFGADTALDLASDSTFNNPETGFNITHVTAAAYYSQPQLRHIPDGTEVLVLQNTRDVPVIAEGHGYATGRAARFTYDTAREVDAVRQSAGAAGTGFAADVIGEGTSYVADTAHEVTMAIDETAQAAQDVGEGARETGGGAFGFLNTGASWLGRSAWNSLETAGEATSSLAQGDVAGAGRAIVNGHHDQNEIDAAASSGFTESSERIASGISQQAGAVGGWVADQSVRIYDRTIVAPREHAGDVVDSALGHGSDVANSVVEHGGNIAADIGERDRYDIPLVPGPGQHQLFVSNPGENQVVSRFNGGLEGAGHHQNNYIEHINDEGISDPIKAYFESVADAGYGGIGTSRAVDVSVPED